jgi:thiosulfate/3-mercaptopyruvate sulfurtransferase
MNSVLPLITPANLAVMLRDQPAGAAPVVLDVRWRLGGPPARPDYDAGHLPTAAFVDLETDLADPPGPGGRHPLPDPERAAARFAELGVDDGSTVVVYDDGNGSVAARAWWLLRWLGLPPGRVAVLDGGYGAWVAEGHPVTTEPPDRPAGGFTARPGAMPVLDADAAGALARDGVLLDARAPARYLGETEPVDSRPGHIPGARNAPFAAHTGEDGHWLAPERLAEHYRGLGVPGPSRPGAYCGSGVTGSSVVLALEYAGLCPPDAPAALYPGSWSEWSADPDRPAAVGPEPAQAPDPEPAP